MKSAGVAAVVLIGIAGLLVGTVFLNGIMLSYLWEWFVVPLGAPSIGILHAIGVAVLVSMLTYEGSGENTDEDAPFKRIITRLVAKGVAFAIAWGVSFGVPQ
jgi:hypothetical protein